MVAEQSGQMEPQGASVELSSNSGGLPFPDEIKEAFRCKYGINPTTTGCQCLCDVEKIG